MDKYEFKGTPAPWENRNPLWFDEGKQSRNSIDIISVADADNYKWLGGVIGENVGIPSEVMQANANLISAAPDLLTACIELSDVFGIMINMCPTGELRNKLTDANIQTIAVIHKALNITN